MTVETKCKHIYVCKRRIIICNKLFFSRHSGKFLSGKYSKLAVSNPLELRNKNKLWYCVTECLTFRINLALKYINIPSLLPTLRYRRGKKRKVVIYVVLMRQTYLPVIPISFIPIISAVTPTTSVGPPFATALRYPPIVVIPASGTIEP